MRSTIILCLIFNSFILFAKKDKTYSGKFGNVSIYVSTIVSAEKMNKAIVVAKYTEILCTKLGYNETVDLHFYETYLEPEKIISYYEDFNSDVIEAPYLHFRFQLNNFDIQSCLNVILFGLNNPKRIEKEKNRLQSIYMSETSKIVSQLLSNKVYRPNCIDFLKEFDNYTYYYKNNKIHLIKKQGDIEEEICVFNDLLDFYVLKENIVVVIEQTNRFSLFIHDKKKVVEINKPEKIYKPLIINMLASNKILFQFNKFSYGNQNRVMIYFIDKELFVEDIDALVK